MKIKKIAVIVIIIFFAVQNFGQNLQEGFINDFILSCEIKENLIVLLSPNSINFRDNTGIWRGYSNFSAFGANEEYSFKNTVIGYSDFAVRLDLKNDSTVQFLLQEYNSINISQKAEVFEYVYKNVSKDNQLFGYNGIYHNGKFVFAMGDGGLIFIENGKISQIIEVGKEPVSAETYKIPDDIDPKKRVNSVRLNKNGEIEVLCEDGGLWNYKEEDPINKNEDSIVEDKDNVIDEPPPPCCAENVQRTAGGLWEKIDSLDLRDKEYPYMFIDDMIFTFENELSGNTRLYKISENKIDSIYGGDISTAAKTPDGFIYVLQSGGNLLVLDTAGKQDGITYERQRTLTQRQNSSNVSANYELTDISIYNNPQTGGYELGFASTKGFFYSADELNGVKNNAAFDYFYKQIPIKKGLKEVYAEPGIINSKYNSCTFEYSLSQDDRVTIDILNYNLDFVCRIVENGFRKAASGEEHSTDRRIDRWDGTINNKGARSVSPGVYYFRITTQKGQKAVGKVVVAR